MTHGSLVRLLNDPLGVLGLPGSLTRAWGGSGHSASGFWGVCLEGAGHLNSGLGWLRQFGFCFGVAPAIWFLASGEGLGVAPTIWFLAMLAPAIWILVSGVSAWGGWELGEAP